MGLEREWVSSSSWKEFLERRRSSSTMDTLQGKLFWCKDDYITSFSDNTNINMDQIYRK